MNRNHLRIALVGIAVLGLLTGCAGAQPDEQNAEKPTPTVSEPSPIPTVEAKPAAVLPEVPIVATVTTRATDAGTGAAMDMTLVAHLPQDLGTPEADQIIEVLTEAGDTSLLSVPAWRADNQVKLMILDLTSTQVGDIAWPANALVAVELGPWVEDDARAPLGIEWSTISGRFGYGTYVSGVMNGHVIAAFVHSPGDGYPLGPWYDYQSSLGFYAYGPSASTGTSVRNCVYAPTALAAPWEANWNWYLWDDFGRGEECGAGFGGE